MDHKEQHHQKHEKDREQEKKEHSKHERQQGKGVLPFHPGWLFGAGVVLMLVAILAYTLLWR